MSPNVPSALTPEYTCDVNEPVGLYDGPAILRAMRLEIPVTCSLQFVWRPNLGVEAVLHWAGAPFLDLDGRAELEVPNLRLRTRVLVRRSVSRSAGQHTAIALLPGQFGFGTATGLLYMTFSIANFPAVIGLHVRRSNQALLARMQFVEGPWTITIDPIPNKDYFEELSDKKGYGLTHVGRIERSDGATFSAGDAEAILDDVSLTLGFSRAAFTGLILRHGYSTSGDRVWSDWSAFRVSHFNNHSTWFSSQRPEVLQNVFDGWRRLRSDPNREVIIAACDLYLDAHVSGLATESRLVLAQAALEGLADGWTIPAGIDVATYLAAFAPQSGAARRIAQIGATFGLPTQVPASLPDLVAMQQPQPGAQAWEKIAWIRNSIAHLNNFPRLVTVSGIAGHQAFEYAAWYLELALLRLLQVTGNYQNRLAGPRWAGEVEPLPWNIP